MKEHREILVEAQMLRTGYTVDRSTWSLSIHNSGLLEQTVNVNVSKAESPIVFLEVWLTKDQLELLNKAIKASRFLEMNGLYIGANDYTDLDIRSICVGEKKLEVYGALQQMDDGRDDMGRFIDLWNTIVSFAPFKGASMR